MKVFEPIEVCPLRTVVLLFASWIAPICLLDGQTNVLTGGFDNTRSGAFTGETALTSTTVTPSRFGRLFALPVDGAVYAQPLYVSRLAIPDAGTHNVLFVATMHNTVFALDADAWNGQPLWSVSLGNPVPAGTYYTKDVDETGILSTPVIDLPSQTLYVVSNNYDNGVVTYQLHALDLTSGAEKQATPMVINGSVPGTGDDSVAGLLAFNAGQHLQRPALLLLNSVLYIAFGSHADIEPYHGWIFAYTAADIHQQVAIYCTTPNGTAAAIWQSGRGLAADASGNIYAVTGNGDFDGVSSFGESVIKFDSNLNVIDWFAPDNWLTWNNADADLGSSGVVFVPNTNLLVTGGKAGTLFSLQSSDLGHTVAGNTQAAQTIQGNSAFFGMTIWESSAGPILYSQNAFYAAVGWRYSDGKIESDPSLLSAATTGTAYGGISVSSNGTEPGTGIVWVTSAPAYGSTQAGALSALEASNLTNVLWTSSANPDDAPGYFAKFAAPTIANGKVYVPTFSDQVMVYGLRSSSVPVPQILAVTNAASYATGAVAPGEIVTVFGTGLGPNDLFLQPLDNGFFDTAASGAKITFDGVAAPILYTSALSATVIVPFGVVGPTTAVRAFYNGQESLAFQADVAVAAPGIFTSDASGSHQCACRNQDLSLNTSSNPAAPGDVLVIYTTGEGLLTSTLADGSLAPNGLSPLAAPVSVMIGGVNAVVQYAGSAPDAVAGLVQINAVVPTGLPPGDTSVTVQVGSVTSPGDVTAAIK